MLELEAVLDRKPKRMSGGQRQRVAMGRAMVREPSVFLFDEPLSNLDAKLRGQMRVEIGRLQRRLGVTTLHVTHDQVEAMTLGDRLVVLDRGRVQQVGRPLDIYREPANRFVADFVGSPPMNFFAGTLQNESDGLVFCCDEWRVALAAERRPARMPKGETTLGVRPEDLALAQEPGPSTISGRLVLAEVLGATTHLHVEARSRRATAVLPSGPALPASSPVHLSIDPRQVHLVGADGTSLLTTRQV